jgi:DNA replication protein DnaC
MLTEPTLEKLKALKFEGMAQALLEQQQKADYAALGFDERFGLLVDAEALYRENKLLRRHLKEAKLKIRQACIEDIDYTPRRELDKAVVRQLASCRFVHEHQNVVITGATGTGKTYLACALA